MPLLLESEKGLDAIVAFFIVVVFNNGPKKSQG